MIKAISEQSMVKTAVVSRKVKCNREDKHNKVFSFERRFQIIFDSISKTANYIPAWCKNPIVASITNKIVKLRKTLWIAKRDCNNKIPVKLFSHMRIIAYGVGNVTDRELGYCYCYIKATKSKTRSNIFKTHSSTNFQIGRRSFCSWSNNNNEKSEPLATMVVTNVKKERDIATQMKPQEKLLYKKICDMATLKLGLARVKNKSPGVDGEVKADITEERLKKLLKSLKVQKYQPRSNKRVSIPKAGGGIRYLGISSAIDKVVQATIVNLLTPIVEPIFIKHSYGFRPGKGCHDALHAIRYG